MNLVLVFLLVLPFWFGWVKMTEEDKFAPALALLIMLQISAVLFNLLPVPPLDGFRAISPWLPIHIREGVMQQSNIFMFVLVMAMWNVPAVYQTFWHIVEFCVNWLGVDPSLIDTGWHQFRFWRH